MEEARVACVDYVFMRSGESVVVLLLNILEYVCAQVVALCDTGLLIHRAFALLAEFFGVSRPCKSVVLLSSSSRNSDPVPS